MLETKGREPVTRSGGEKILIVEDDPVVALLERRRLERAGYCVVDATTSEEALRVLQRDDVELAVLDQNLPDGTGLELYERLKADGHDLPVIMVTSLSEDATVIEALRAGVRDYVTKSPRYLDYLPEAVERVLGQVRLEQRLGESERRFRSLIQNASDVITILEADGTIRYDSPAIERVLGYRPDERLGTSAFEYMHPEDVERVRSSFAQALEDPGAVQPPIEFRLRHKEGGWRQVEVTRSNLLEDPAVGGIVANSRDVTERKRAEEALKESEQRFRLSFRDAAIGMALLSPDGRYLQVNHSMCEMLGYTEEELLEKTFQDITHPDDLEEDLKLGYGILEGRASTFSMEKRYIRKDRSVVWVNLSVSLLRDLCGEPLYSIAQVQDISKRRKAEEEFRRSESQLAEAQRLANLGSWEWDISTDTVDWSDELYRIYGLKPSEFGASYKQFLERVHPDDREFVEETIETALENPTAFSYDCRIVRSDGDVRTLHAQGTVVVDGAGKPIRMYGTAQDITEAKRLEEALRENEAKYRALVEHAPAVTYTEVVSQTGILTYVSPQIEGLLGYTPDELDENESFWALLHPDDRDRVRAEDEHAKRTDERFDMEYRLVARDGSVVWVRDEAVLVSREEDGTLHWQGVVHDVTERREAEEKYRTLVERIPVITYIQEVDEPSRTTYISPQYEAILGYSPQESLRDPEHWTRILHPDDKDRVLSEDRRTNESGEPFIMEYRQIARDGSVIWLRDEARLVRDEGGKPLYWLGVQADITERRQAEESLRQSEARHVAVLDTAFDAIVTMTADGNIESFNKEAENVFGYTAGEIVGSPVTLLMPKQFREAHRAGLGRYLKTGAARVIGRRRIELVGRRKNGEEFPLELSLAEVREGENHLFTSIIRDITERKEAEGRLRHQAFHDPLTDLPNRNLFLDRLKQALLRAERRESKVAVLFMDIDNFKVINDSLGHELGDRLLVAVSERLRRNCLRQEDTLSRFGGDEFTVLIDSAPSVNHAARVAERIAEELRAPFSLDEREVFVTVSIGIAMSFSDQSYPEELLRNADVAMYRAKEAGKGHYQVFDPSMHGAALKRLHLEYDLRRAIEREEFTVHYQPKVMLESEEIIGMEALVRWEHPQRGLISPADFIPLAEETGLIVPLGQWVLEEACRQTKEWQDHYPGYASLTVSVNLSPKQFRQPDLIGSVAQALQETGLAPHALGLEVTETAMAHNPDSAKSTLQELKDLGIEIEVDDFGTGYSSLSRLRHLPIDILKIDRSFVSSLEEDAKVEPVVSSIVDLAAGLGLRVVAEGVETLKQAKHLRALGCEIAQGYYFSKPLPREAAEALLAASTSMSEVG